MKKSHNLAKALGFRPQSTIGFKTWGTHPAFVIKFLQNPEFYHQEYFVLEFHVKNVQVEIFYHNWNVWPFIISINEYLVLEFRYKKRLFLQRFNKKHLFNLFNNVQKCYQRNIWVQNLLQGMFSQFYNFKARNVQLFEKSFVLQFHIRNILLQNSISS